MRFARIVLIVFSVAASTRGTVAQSPGPVLQQPVSYQSDQFYHPEPYRQASFAPADEASAPREKVDGQAAPAAACVEPSCAAESAGCGAARLCRGLELGGWLDAGATVSSNSPVDRYNGVVTFNDRDGEAQMNQLWFFLDREAATGGYGWAWGGRIDFLYGTDARFTQACDGLEANWDQRERFYQCALPQFYFDVALNNLTIRTGHFFTPLGYEVVPAPQNFFYSHAYTMQYAEPFTHTGILGIYKLSDQWKLSTGVHRGMDQFDDTDGRNSLGFLGHLAWTSRDERLGLAFGINASEQNQDIAQVNYDSNVTDYSLVGTVKLTERLTWVVQHDWYQRTTFDVNGGNLSIDGYGLNQYWLYTINERWAAGMRLEWFRDHNGALVRGLGNGNVASHGGFAGSFYEVTLGLNWKPTERVSIRPEVRWDWFDPSHAGVPEPFDSGDSNDQFLLGCDFIVTW